MWPVEGRNQESRLNQHTHRYGSRHGFTRVTRLVLVTYPGVLLVGQFVLTELEAVLLEAFLFAVLQLLKQRAVRIKLKSKQVNIFHPAKRESSVFRFRCRQVNRIHTAQKHIFFATFGHISDERALTTLSTCEYT